MYSLFICLFCIPFLALYYEGFIPSLYFYYIINKNSCEYKIHLNNTRNSLYQNFHQCRTITRVPKSRYKVSDISYNFKRWVSKEHYECISMSVLKRELKAFYYYYNKYFKEHPYFAIIFKIKFANGDVRSISNVQVSRLEEFDKLFAVFSHVFLLEDFADAVSEQDNNSFDEEGLPIGNIIFEFKPMKNYRETKYEKLYHPSTDFKIKGTFQEGKYYIEHFSYKGYKIPATMNLHEWPNITFWNDYREAHSSYTVMDKSENSLYDLFLNITIDNKNTSVSVVKGRKILFTFKDYMLDPNDLTNFKRVVIETVIENGIVKDIEKGTYHFNNGKIVLYMEGKDVEFIPKLKPPKPVKDFDSLIKILTLDIETRDIETRDIETGELKKEKIPVCMCIYDGSETMNFLFEDPKSWHDDMVNALKTIFTKKYDYYNVYIHNMSYFDVIFIIDSLAKLGKVKPLMREDKVLKLAVGVDIGKKKQIVIKFYDSFLLLTNSLRDLSKSFNIQHKKSIFPLLFLNEELVSLDYKGVIPKYKYFPGCYTDKFTIEDYYEYCKLYENKEWNLKKELISYCEIDTIGLYEILVKFRKEIYSMFKLDITKSPTIPSFSFKNYRTNFMAKENIPIIMGKLHNTLKQALYGGITDVFRGIGWNVNSYDINSLYPYSMKYFPMPVGKPTYFSGDIFLVNKNPFGFFKVNVKAPLHLKIGILPTKIKTWYGIRTVFPVGNWTGWYFSEEIKFAMKYGYKFEILEGYLFERGYIFSDYIDVLYKIKSTVSKDDPWYYISKLLQNSLFGRFGLNPINEVISIVSSEESEEIIREHPNVKIITLLSGNVLVKYTKESEELELENISVPIAAAVTAWSRIHMYHYLIKYGNNILAIDTDGIKVDCQIDPTEIDSKELGKMKYEYTFIEAVFPAPKVYGGILEKPYKQYEKELVKVKGLKNPISYGWLKTILNKDRLLPIPQEKWKRELSLSTILIREEQYSLGLGETKRQFIYNSWGDFVDSWPLYLKDGKIVNRNFPTVYYLPEPPIVYYLPLPKSHIIYYLPKSHIIYYLPKPPIVLYLPKPSIVYYLPKPKYIPDIDYSLSEPIIKDYYQRILDGSWINYKPLW